MTEENQKNDLGDMSRNWHERLRALRLSMAKNYGGYSLQEPSKSEDSLKSFSDDELFAGSVRQQPSEEQIFNEVSNFSNSIKDTHIPAVHHQTLDVGKLLKARTGHKRFSPIQIILAVAIILVAAVLFYELRVPVSISTQDYSQVSYAPSQNQPQPAVADTAPIVQQQPIESKQPSLDSTQQPLSLKTAQTFYLNENYAQALDVYRKLCENLPVNTKEEMMKDFLQLQIALCMERVADYNQAALGFRKVLNSNSPAVKVIAYYHCGLLEMQKKQFLNARTKAYQAIALIDAIDFDKDWAISLKRNCFFLAAQALTREVLSLCDADKEQPENLWPAYDAADDIFVNLDESRLRTFLNSGSQGLTAAALSPQINKFDNHNGLDVYDIACSGASIEELLARFTANSNVDLNWNLDSDETAVRKQLVYLHLFSSPARQFATVAAGCTGLLAQMDDNGLLNVYNPAIYTRVSEHISILSDQAVSLWQEFILKFPEDSRHASAHFALGLLHAPRERFTESISEYKLVANRFSRSPLAPYALLNSSKLKNSLRDYVGAYEDSRQLIEQFPDSQIAVNAHLYYADTAGKANLLEESVRLYSKVYNLGLSPETQIAAALGAGKSSYALGDYQAAEKWLLQYTTLAASKPGSELYSAYLYLGKTYLALNNPDSASTAFQYALLGVPLYLPKEQYLGIVPTLIDVYTQQGSFVQALELLEAVNCPALSLKESVEILLLKSKTLCDMGLVDKAFMVIGDRADYISDPQLKARIYFQLCQCHIEKGDLNAAHKMLSEILVLATPGPFMNEAALKLADVCLKLGQNSQTVSVCRQLLDLQPSEPVKQKALEYLASAYNQNQNYDKAALALVGQWK